MHSVWWCFLRLHAGYPEERPGNQLFFLNSLLLVPVKQGWSNQARSYGGGEIRGQCPPIYCAQKNLF